MRPAFCNCLKRPYNLLQSMIEYISKWFNGENSLRGATKLLVVTLFISNVLGVIRDRYLAQKIPTDLLDTYYAAFRLPDLVFNILILGAIASAFIPVFTQVLSTRSKQQAFAVASSVISIAITLTLIVLAVLYFLLPSLVPIIVPAFSPPKQQFTLELSRLFLLSPIFFGLSYFLGGILNSHKRFFVYSLAPLVYNLSIIIATRFFADRYGVFAPAVGVVLGSLFHMLIQLPTAIGLGFRFSPSFNYKDPSVRKIGKLMVPRTIGLGAQQLVLLGFTAIGSGLGAGAVAIYNLADNIQTMPTAVFGNSVASAVFPHLSEAVAIRARQKFARYFERSVSSVLFFLVPATAGVYMLRAQIVRLLLGSGFFGWEQTIETARTLGFFAIALVFSGLIPLLARSFYAWQDTKTPTTIGVGSSLISLGAGFLLSREFGVGGLALGIVAGSIINAGVLYTILKERVPEIDEKKILLPTLKMVVATVVMATSLQITKIYFGTIYDLDRYIEVLIQTVSAVVVSVAVYFGLMKLLGMPHFGKFFDNGKKAGPNL